MAEACRAIKGAIASRKRDGPGKAATAAQGEGLSQDPAESVAGVPPGPDVATPQTLTHLVARIARALKREGSEAASRMAPARQARSSHVSGASIGRVCSRTSASVMGCDVRTERTSAALEFRCQQETLRRNSDTKLRCGETSEELTGGRARCSSCLDDFSRDPAGLAVGGRAARTEFVCLPTYWALQQIPRLDRADRSLKFWAQNTRPAKKLALIRIWWHGRPTRATGPGC